MAEDIECEGLETYEFSNNYFSNDITSHFETMANSSVSSLTLDHIILPRS